MENVPAWVTRLTNQDSHVRLAFGSGALVSLPSDLVFAPPRFLNLGVMIDMFVLVALASSPHMWVT